MNFCEGRCDFGETVGDKLTEKEDAAWFVGAIDDDAGSVQQVDVIVLGDEFRLLFESAACDDFGILSGELEAPRNGSRQDSWRVNDQLNGLIG